MNELQARQEIVRLARTWIGTPYLSNALVRGAGVDCAMLLLGVFQEADLVPKSLDPRPYPPQWHLHKNEEKYKQIVELFAQEIQEIEVQPGDVVLFKVGYLYAHGAIVTSWPNVVHARAPSTVQEEDLSTNTFGKHALWNYEKKFFSYWKKAA